MNASKKGLNMDRIAKILSTNEPATIYEELILLGKEAPLYPDSMKLPANLIKGCQSELYLTHEKKEGKLYFSCASEALISKGIACFVLALINGKKPEEILHYPFSEIKQINLPLILSPSRSNGLKAILQTIKQIALKEYLSEQKENQ